MKSKNNSRASSAEPEPAQPKKGVKRPHPGSAEDAVAQPSEGEASPKKQQQKPKEEVVPSCYRVKVVGGPKRDPKVNTTLTLEHSALR